MGNAPSPNKDAPTPKSTKSKMPYIIAGIVIGLMVSVFALKNASDNKTPPDGNSLAVFNFENLSAENENDRTGQILQELIITDLSGINDFKIYSSQRLFDIQKQMGTKDSRFIDPSLAMDIAKEAGASSMMTGNIIKMGNTIVFTSRILDVNDGSVIKSRKVEGTDLYKMVDKLSSYVIEDLNLGIIETVDLAVSEKTSSSMEAYKFFLTGVDLLNASKFKEAVSELEKSVAIDPSFKEALYKLAVAQWWGLGEGQGGSDSSSIYTIDTYLALPGLSGDEIKLGQSVKNIILNKATDAIEPFKYLTNLYPDNKEYWYMLGEAHYHGDFKYMQSLDAFETAVELDPEFTLSYEHIFGIYEELVLYERGIRTAKKLVKAFPKKAMGYDYLSQFSRLTSNHELAIQTLEQAKKYFPENVHGYQRTIATNYMHMGRYNDVLKICDEILAEDIDYESKRRTLNQKKTVYFIFGEYSKCIELIQMQISLAEANNRPNNVAGANIDMALAYQYKGDYEKAIYHFDLSTKIIKENQGMIFDFLKYFDLYYRALLHVKNSDETSLISIVSSLRDLLDNEKNGMIKQYVEPAYNALLFEQLAVQGKSVEALALLNKTKIKEYNLEEHYYTAAKIYINKGDYKLALKCADEMQTPTRENFAYDITFPRAHYIRGMTYEAMGNAEKAKESYNALLDLWKNADADILELIDTKKRLAKLKQTS
tara:strand:- start:182 stop:2311 length:2130 start_codon:yes stop_codon:yes gene_type:complete